MDGVVDYLKSDGVHQNILELVQGWLEAGTGLEAFSKIKQLFPNTTLIDEVERSIKNIIGIIKELGVPENNLVFDPSIARGLDYYTSTVFEIIVPNYPEFGSICSGGRYDNLISKFSDEPLSAVGGSIGIDRLFEVLKEMDLVSATDLSKVIILNLGVDFQNDCLELVNTLRSSGVNVEIYYEPDKLDKQFKYAESKHIKYAIFIGKDEMKNGGSDN